MGQGQVIPGSPTLWALLLPFPRPRLWPSSHVRGSELPGRAGVGVRSRKTALAACARPPLPEPCQPWTSLTGRLGCSELAPPLPPGSCVGLAASAPSASSHKRGPCWAMPLAACMLAGPQVKPWDFEGALRLTAPQGSLPCPGHHPSPLHHCRLPPRLLSALASEAALLAAPGAHCTTGLWPGQQPC